MKIRNKLFFLLLIFSSGVIIIAGVFTYRAVKAYFENRLEEELFTHSNSIEYVLTVRPDTDESLYAQVRNLAWSMDLRLTLISKDGIVLFDSDIEEADVPKMENHSRRPEIRDALWLGRGTSIRHSTTLDEEIFYFAKSTDKSYPESTFIKETAVIRVAIPMTKVEASLDDILSKIILASVIAFLIVSISTLFIAERIAKPLKEMADIAAEIQHGNLDKRLPISSNDEIGKLGNTLNRIMETLNEDIDKLHKLERVRSEFLGNVSHELRTPIFTIQGMLETLLEGALDDPEARNDFVKRALSNTQRLNTLINDLIEISRIESGDMKMSFRYFNLREFLTQVVSEIQPLAKLKNVTLESMVPQEKIEVYGDRDRLKQALINLIDNSIKYNKPDGKVTVRSHLDGQKVKITVEDTGVGIPPEHLSRIFERFYRVDKERSREAGGTGLGLAIVKHIVEAHGSKIEVQSKEGEWSKFSFYLKS